MGFDCTLDCDDGPFEYCMAKNTRHAVYEPCYHVVFVPEYREPHLTGVPTDRLCSISEELCDDKEFGLVEAEITPDQRPPVQPMSVQERAVTHPQMGDGISAQRYNERFPNRFKWTRSYCVDSAGIVSMTLPNSTSASNRSSKRETH